MDKLIIKHLAFDITSLDFASVKYFAETGQITGNLLIRLRNMLKEASDGKTSNDASALPIPDVSKSACIRGFEAKSHYCIECENEDNCNVP